MTIALAVIRDLFEGAVGVTTRKYSECMTSWTKHVRAGMSAPPLMVAARVAGRRHVSDVPRASVYWGLSRTPQSTLRRPTFHSMAKTAHALSGHSLVSPGFGRERRKHTFGFGQLLGQ
jgi:hypothetical protein